MIAASAALVAVVGLSACGGAAVEEAAPTTTEAPASTTTTTTEAPGPVWVYEGAAAEFGRETCSGVPRGVPLWEMHACDRWFATIEAPTTPGFESWPVEACIAASAGSLDLLSVERIAD